MVCPVSKFSLIFRTQLGLKLGTISLVIPRSIESLHSLGDLAKTFSFLFAGDWFKPYHLLVPKILERGVPVLIYAGDADFICKYLKATTFLLTIVAGWAIKHGPKLWNGQALIGFARHIKGPSK